MAKDRKNIETGLLGEPFEGLAGKDLIERLAQERRLGTLEAFWRHGNAEVAADVAGGLAKSAHPDLAHLLVAEIVEPAKGDPVPTAVIETITQDRPALSESDVALLADRLEQDTPLDHPTYEGNRAHLEIAVVSQTKSKRGGELALAIVRGGTRNASNPEVQRAAYARCAAEPRQLQAAADVLAAEAAADAGVTPELWNRLALFVEAAQDDGAVPGSIQPLVELLVVSAAQACPTSSFPDPLAEPIWTSAADTYESVITGEKLPGTPGAQALVRLAIGAPTAALRARLFASVAAHQPDHFNILVSEREDWDTNGWRRRLNALRKLTALDYQIVALMLDQAPMEAAHETVELALAQAGTPEDAPIPAVATRLAAHIKSLALDGDDASFKARVGAIRWPKSSDTVETREKLDALLAQTWPEGEAVGIILAAWSQGAIDETVAARLVPEFELEGALRQLADAPKRREQFVAAALAIPREQIVRAGEVVQRETFGVDLARALAGTRPSAAFAGADEAWPGLGSDEKDAVVKLLQRHGTLDETALFEAIIADTRAENAPRRAQVITLVSNLTERGAALPGFVVDALEAGATAPRRAAVDAVGKVAPRDLETVERVRAIAGRQSPLKATAINVLETLAAEYIRDLGEVDEAGLGQAIQLVGATGRLAALDPLLAYVGANAAFDDVDLRRRAAAGILNVCQAAGKQVSGPQLAKLVELLEGEETAEVDSVAFDNLSKAVGAVQLGDAEALRVLYDDVGIPPPTSRSPEALYGDELEYLVRHLSVLERERARGEIANPVAVLNMDIVAERLARRAYLLLGGSEPMKAKIAAGEEEPRYGVLLGAMKSVSELHKACPHLEVLHDLRSTKTFAHASEDDITENEMTAASEGYLKGTRVLVQAIQAAQK